MLFKPTSGQIYISVAYLGRGIWNCGAVVRQILELCWKKTRGTILVKKKRAKFGTIARTKI